MPQSDKEFLIRVKADIEKAVADMRNLSSEIGTTAKESGKAARSTRELGLSMDGLVRAASAYLSIATVIKTLKMADEWKSLENRIAAATKETGDYAQVSESLYEITRRNGTAMADTVATFQRLSLARAELGATNADILKVTNAVQQLGVMSGSSSSAMQAGMLQFSQAMSSGVVRAEELNSILENMPAVANRIAQGMGLTTGELRGAVLEGKVLSRQVFDALLGQTDEIAAEMAGMPVSLERAWNTATTSLSRFISKLDDITGVTNFITLSLQGWAGILDAAIDSEIDLANKQRERLQILTRIRQLESYLEDFTGPQRVYDAMADALANLRKELQQVDEQLRAANKQTIDPGSSKPGAGSGKGGTSEPAILSQKELDKQIKTTNKSIEEQTRLFEQQARSVEAAQNKVKEVQGGFDAARKAIRSDGEEKKPDIISVSNDLLNAEGKAAAGDYDEAIKAANAAKDVIVKMGEEGQYAKIVLDGLLDQAEQIGVGAAKSVEGEQQSALDKIKTEMSDLLAKAEELKAMKVGFDADGALTEAATLRAQIQEQFNANPLTVPVTTTQLGAPIGAPTGAGAAKAAAAAPVSGQAEISSPDGQRVVRYKVEVDAADAAQQMASVSKALQDAATPVVQPVHVSTQGGVTTFSDSPNADFSGPSDQVSQWLADEVMQFGGK
jgi:tape measure domain-containing protein